MKLHIKVTLDGGGTVTIRGEDLTAEDVNEVFAILGKRTIEGDTTPEPIDQPLPIATQQQIKESFREHQQQEKT